MSTRVANSTEQDFVTIAHGGGGDLTCRLIDEHILPRLGNRLLSPLNDSAILEATSGRTVFTTDAFVVQPLEFPGGDIGRLAVCGTVNDLAVMGATPRALSLALVLEEGLPLVLLDRILDSVARAAQEAEVPIATGDTKVIERHRGDGLMITTAGVGHLAPDVQLAMSRIEPGDAILVNGRIADHGLAVMSVREGLTFETELVSDAAPLNGIIAELLATGARVRFMRDATRGGVAGVLADVAAETGLSVEIEESKIPLSKAAHHTAECFGLDPLTVANEGRFIAVVAASDAPTALAACRKHPLGTRAAVIGYVTESAPPMVELCTKVGGRRVVQRPYGEELPRIC